MGKLPPGLAAYMAKKRKGKKATKTKTSKKKGK